MKFNLGMIINFIFIMLILLSIAFVCRYLYGIFYPFGGIYSENILIEVRKYYLRNILLGLISFFIFLFLYIKLNESLKISFIISLFAAIITLYSYETYLEFFKKSTREIQAESMNIKYDDRSKINVIQDLRNKNIDVYLNIFPKYFVSTDGLNTAKGKIYPLGNVSKIKTILDNENGSFPIVNTDEYGFNNPIDLYNQNRTDLLLLGDSYVEGYSVSSQDTIASHLRKLNFKTISLGKAGNGPLTLLACLLEYGNFLKPKIILWFYSPNDFEDLALETDNNILVKYLNNTNFSQNLISKQPEIDKALKYLLNNELEKKIIQEKEFNNTKFKNLLKLKKIRSSLDLYNTYNAFTHTDDFSKILLKANKIVSKWDGDIIFVYLPSHQTLKKEPDINRKFVLKTIEDLKIPIIDMHEVFIEHEDIDSLFPLRLGGHYNSKGYKLVAETIKIRINNTDYLN